ncbi:MULTISPECIES: hypothetical protein [unclassified Mesorhizobium]|uniref:hypothetical protein n=1 Tax=unclassified Mesorhizobium TaxID=325217 RepID=UPI000BB07664|nr:MULTISPECIES: hypothetical protein [unclassified Mesorhizobium]PBC23477.1 hypothetical protein CK226_10145 [Mesorhizobium sp. WSM4311]TRD06843.1 hypothetical protein FJV82_08940 [Mesorhizobium sp. WSM4305]
MADFYDDMANMAVALLGEFKQGAVTLKRETPGVPDPAQPWVPVEPTVETWPLSAVVKRMHQRYENGILIVETGDMVTFAVPAVEPMLTDMIVIDGAERTITNLTPIPSAGTAVAWKAWCAG